jgi:hypothetical protein
MGIRASRCCVSDEFRAFGALNQGKLILAERSAMGADASIYSIASLIALALLLSEQISGPVHKKGKMDAGLRRHRSSW